MLVAVAALTVYFLLLYRMADVWMYDSNFHTFRDLLSPQQQEAITWSARRLMEPVIVALVATNLCWAVLVGVVLFRKRKHPG
jgi:hypothetical protein